jgi:diguanylate cyclase
MASTSQLISGYADLLKSKVSKYALYGAFISVTAVIIATIISSYFHSNTFSLNAFVQTQKTNPVLWVLDGMPFVFVFWGQYVSTVMGYEAGALVIEQTKELNDQTVTLKRQAIHDATHDSLTDLPNRILLYDRLEQAIKTAKREGKKGAVLLLDLDRFKEINDALGYFNGDRLLKQVSMRLSSVIRESDTLARMGDDEFAILLASITENAVIDKVVKKIQNALLPPFSLEGLPIDVQASVGAVLFPDHGNDVDTLIQRVDVAMYAAKQHNDSFVVYYPKLDKQNLHRLTLIGELRQAMDEDELFLQYQPKVNTKTNCATEVEALVRWQHKIKGMIPPDDFIGLAERTGQIIRLTRWVLKHALQQGVVWHKSGLDIGVAVNLSTRNLVDPEFPDVIAGLLASYDFPAQYLMLEITESGIMADPERALDILTRIAEMGVRLSIDDFGTGYSSLSYLKKLPVSEIKIDKSFVMEMLKYENDAKIVHATIELGHNLGLTVVAEGVENEETLLKLKSLGCDFFQGYYISKPITAKDFSVWYNSSVWGKGANRG